MLGKYDQNKHLKKTKARTFQKCDVCNGTIEPREYVETEKDKFLHSLHAMRFCSECYEKDNAQLLSTVRLNGKSTEYRYNICKGGNE